MAFERLIPLTIAFGLLQSVAACSDSSTDDNPPFVEPRAACLRQNPQRDVFFGDLHVHTALSFDAWVFDIRTTPAQAFQFAQGLAIDDPLGGPDPVQLARPLDFAAVTDHAEYLGEVDQCTATDSEVAQTQTCSTYRQGGADAIFDFGGNLTSDSPQRFLDVCGIGGERCRTVARDVWARIQDAAEAAYDRSEACRFTSFIGYEWTAAVDASNLHRNIIFKNERVPDLVASYFEFPNVTSMHRTLESSCLNAGTGCDVIAIPHNTNWSNGNMFFVEYPDAPTVEAQQTLARRRQSLEPLFEIYQHKGDAECLNGLSGVLGEPDELCGFEKLRTDVVDCGDGTGFGGAGGIGCVSRLDFLRGILVEGMKEEQRIGVNPYRLGVIAATDSHNGTPGEVDERRYRGHWGNNEDTVERRLGPNPVTPGGVIFSGGGLTAAWSEENTRESLFEAFRRREVYGTSGPRMVVRFFGGWTYPDNLCSQANLVSVGYADGVPMGADLPAPPSPTGAPTFVVSAMMDAGTSAAPGTPLERVQIVKGWIDAQGQAFDRVFTVAGGDDGSTVDLNTCGADARGASTLCTVWTDPDFDPTMPAYYYARVVENPTCRWSWRDCLSRAEADRPPTCSDDTIPKTIRERAWTSPIWYRP